MGCSFSSKSKVLPRKTTLQQSHISTVRDTWAVISEQKEKFGVYVYNNLLSRGKEMRRLFPRLVVEDGQERFQVNEAEVRRHALLVMDGLGLAVECLHDANKLHHFLRIVGLRHATVGVKAEMLQKLFPAIEKALHMLLGRSYNKRARHAWREFFDHITDIMKLAMLDAEKHTSQEKLSSV